MLPREDNERLTQVAAGTPMGTLLRRYWMPALLSAELEADGAPVRVRLLGEQLIAFRDSDGRVGLLEELCAHRRASLFLGRNEQCGLRCVYHGWKYDIEGRIVDMSTEPADSTFKERVRQPAYPTCEIGDVVWAYMGSPEQMPPKPYFGWTQPPTTHRSVSRNWQECSYLQAVEGGVDSAHVGWLHRVLQPEDGGAGFSGIWTENVVADEVDPTDYGHVYACIRSVPDDRKWARVYHFVMPFHVMFPLELGYGGTGIDSYTPMMGGTMWVPMDDENAMMYLWTVRLGEEPLTLPEREWLDRIRGLGPGTLTDDFRKRRNRQSDWGIDRALQKSTNFSGIEGILAQDHAVQEGMGPIVDRRKEHLGKTDHAVVRTRRVLLDALDSLEAGREPPGLTTSYYGLFGSERILPNDADWRAHLLRQSNEVAE